jgi:cytochrome P450
MDQPTVTDSVSGVREVLAAADAHPPEAPQTLGTGVTAELRSRMARFTGGEKHASCRGDVLYEVSRLDLTKVSETASELTRQMLPDDDTGSVDGVRLASTVPSLTLLRLLGLPETMDTVGDIGAMAAAIGRGEPATTETDASVQRLLELAALLDAPDAGVSILYQNHDATRAFLLTHLHAEATGSSRELAVVSTVRTAAASLTIDGAVVAAGSSLRLDLRAADLEFGAGVHECPGRHLANAICAGMMSALGDAGWRPAPESIVCNDDRIPVELQLVCAIRGDD